LNNIRVIDRDLDVSKILNQLKQYPDDWGIQKRMDKTRILDPLKYIVSADVLQLVMGAINKPGDDVRDSEICIATPAFYRHTEIVKWCQSRFDAFARCAFLSLPVGQIVGKHIDIGTYYLRKDRYHLAIQGKYKYMVGNEEVIVEPGTFLWFNNKEMHGTENIGNEVRITFVVDVPYHSNNP
jgi:hypothetical protein